jgi:hypothetical protein
MLIIALFLIVAWILCVVLFKITVMLVHLLVIFAVIAVIVHYYRKAKNTLAS